jgi:hypothetical protein
VNISRERPILQPAAREPIITVEKYDQIATAIEGGANDMREVSDLRHDILRIWWLHAFHR